MKILPLIRIRLSRDGVGALLSNAYITLFSSREGVKHKTPPPPLPRLVSTSISVLSLLGLLSVLLLPVQAVAGEMEYYFYDQQGSLLEVTGEQGQAKLKQYWTAWGRREVVEVNAEFTRLTGSEASTALAEQGLPLHLGYTGHKEVAGIVFAGDNRLYDPELQRFYNPDDRTNGGIIGQNRFAYANNNPLTYIDPDGHQPTEGSPEEGNPEEGSPALPGELWMMIAAHHNPWTLEGARTIIALRIALGRNGANYIDPTQLLHARETLGIIDGPLIDNIEYGDMIYSTGVYANSGFRSLLDNCYFGIDTDP